jgi:dTDP-4-dehydrorhamnose reductase
MMRVLLLGSSGQLGWELARCLPPLGDLFVFDYPDVDMGNPDSIRRTVREVAPQLVINATAYTAVDKAESERDLAYAVNAAGPGVLAEQAKRLGAALIHYSTDYVFDGEKDGPYTETDVPNPLNVYGASKLEGERAVQAADGAFLVLRTAWVYSLRGDGFVTKVLHWARRNEVLRIVDDQISNPTWARMLAETTALLIAGAHKDLGVWFAERKGIYHLAGSGFASRFEWARKILELDPRNQEQTVKQILPDVTANFPSAALRPAYSVLDCNHFTSTFKLRLPAWQEALRLAIMQEQ